ncbi:hypothetical protein J5226_19355 [Lysobacter sp. K5869]|uniref:hypothetical protein n=1 Tax=Lysobacter sp. K5869 TaxID=2820808 RepID=UPI001C0634FF|nr:hypothetical protein [Lysobacter sp. K5869]QWP75744.1 hypothetical protein J5226_19355 [Lysobacter sp. K5869]
MSVPQHATRRLSLVLACAAALCAVAGAASAAEPSASDASQNGRARGCARQFEAAQRADMESFRDYDADTFRAGHDERAVTVFDSGGVRIGIDAIMAALAGHFQNREAKWSWTERYRVVDGCRSAYILYETVYEIPRIGYRQRALTGVTYTHDGAKWLAIADQGTRLP